jgi:hypothetical protein
MPKSIPGEENSIDAYVQLGFTHIIAVAEGPDWDLGELPEVLSYRDRCNAARV